MQSDYILKTFILIKDEVIHNIIYEKSITAFVEFNRTAEARSIKKKK